MSLNLKKYEVDMKDKWNKFVKSNKKDSWILFGFEGRTFDLIHCGSGDYGMDEFIEEVSDGRIMYGAISVQDPNTGLQKIVFVFWQGESVPNHIRGTVATFRSAIKNFFKGYSIEITATSEQDLSIDSIKDKVKSASGANYSIHEEKSKTKTHEICSYKKVDPISEINRARNIQSQPQAAEFSEQPPSEENVNSAKTMREQRKKEMDEMIKQSRTKDKTKPENEHKLNKADHSFSKPAFEEETSRTKSTPISPNLKFKTSDIFQEKNLNSAEKLKETRLKEMQEMIKQSKSVEKSESNESRSTGKVDNSFNRPTCNDRNSPTKSVPRGAKSELLTHDKSQEKEENLNSLQNIKELRQKELQETIKQSKVKAMKDKITSEQSPASSYKKTAPGSEIQTTGNVQSTKEAFNEKPEEIKVASVKKDLGIELPSISSKKALIQNLFQPQPDLQSTSHSSNTQISEQKIESTIEMPIPLMNVDEEHKIMVEVLYDFTAEDDEDLSITQGEILTIVEINGDWWTAIDCNGTRGRVPANYVEEIDLTKIKTSPQALIKDSQSEDSRTSSDKAYDNVDLENDQCCIAVVAINDFVANEEGELSFAEGDNLTVIDKSQSYWWKATNSQGDTGDIPSNYVKEFSDDRSAELFSEDTPEYKKYKATHSYEKEDENELSIEKDEILLAVILDDSGWWLVKNDEGEEGYVPSSFLAEA